MMTSLTTEKPLPGWRQGAKVRRCNTFSSVWAAIYGCVGSSNAWRYTVNGFGHRVAEYACPVCQAERAKVEAMNHRAHQEYLGARQTEAGVADYRRTEARWVNGRPTLIRK